MDGILGGQLPPGLAGYVLAQQQGRQNQAQQMQMLGLLSSLRNQATEQQMKQQLFPLQLQTEQAKLTGLQRQNDFTQQLGPLMAADPSKVSPEVWDMLALKAAASGHPGAVGLAGIAKQQRQLAETKAAITGMQSAPGVTPNTPNDDEGNPMPVIPAQPGILGPLASSPYVGPAAQSFQGVINQGAPGLTAEQVMSNVNRLTQMDATARNQKATQDAIAARTKDNIQLRIDNRAPSDSSPYANVQSDGKGGFVGLNKRTLRMEPIAMAPGATSASAPGGAGQIGGDALEMAASRYLQDGTLPPNMGRGTQGTANTVAILSRAADLAKAKGMDGEATRINQVANKSLQSAMTGLERQRANVMSYEKTALAGADIAIEMSNKVDRTGVPLVNKWINAGRVAVAGDPDVSRLNNAVETLTNEYAKVMSGSSGGQATTVSMQEHARKMLSGAMTKEQFNGVIDLMKREMTQTREKAFDSQINEMKDRMKVPSATSAPQRRAVDKTFGSAADAEAAAARGDIKAGDRITVGGKTGTWK